MKFVAQLFQGLAIDTSGINGEGSQDKDKAAEVSGESSWEDWIGGSLTWNQQHAGVDAYLSTLLPTKDCFFSGVYLWSAETIRKEVVRKGAMANALIDFGLLAIGASMSGENIFLDCMKGEVYWSHRVFYDFNDTQVVYCDAGKDKFLPLSESSFGILLTYIGDFTENFLLAWMKGKYFKLFQTLDENWILLAPANSSAL